MPLRPKQKLSREEYRAALLLERRRTVRTVRNTLIGIALIAGIWFLLLLAKDRTSRQPGAQPAEPVPAEKAGE